MTEVGSSGHQWITWEPVGLDAEAVYRAVAALPDPTPENVFEDSKKPEHVLHATIWSEGDQVWANRGRIDYVRKIMRSIGEVVVVSGRTITVRSIEFVRPEARPEGLWSTLERIRADNSLLDAYEAEVIRLQEQALGKMTKLRALRTTGAAA